MVSPSQILAVLADGRFHSGREIADSLGSSTAVVRRNIGALIKAGCDIRGIGGRGYCLNTRYRPLSRDRILYCLGPKAAAVGKQLYVCDIVDSTNQFLLRKAARGECFHGAICVAEAQSAGRGRHGRSWIATPYANIMLSLSWKFDNPAQTVSGLSLAAAVAVVRGLTDYGVQGVQLKWPNDVVWQQRKLGGVLVDARHKASGDALVVIGVGLNVYLAPQQARAIEQEWTDLTRITDAVVDRDCLAASMIKRLHEMLETYGQRGFKSFRDEWEGLHMYQGQRVKVLHDRVMTHAWVLGAADDGALRVMKEDGRIQAYYGGEISLRASP
jgi:BirA family biotin operon repressor/biotin-[acetyl-CoA-carboxylase] ligase